MYDHLKAGRTIVVSDASNLFRVDRRTIQRDINEIRCYFADCNALDGSNLGIIVFNKTRGGYVLENVA